MTKTVDQPKISLILPVLNEAEGLKALIDYLRNNSQKGNLLEIIVVDGGSSDATIKIAKSSGAILLQTLKGRAIQMNAGASQAKGEILYFLHADSFPPKDFDRLILHAVTSGSRAGCFRMKFDDSGWFYRFFSWFTRWNHPLCRGGDQSLFVTKELFNTLGGFDPSYKIYEDNEFIQRLYREERFAIIPKYIITSARKYREVGKFKLQFHFGIIQCMHFMGAGPESIYKYYREKILD